MDELKKLDPTFTDYVPANCAEAVQLFYRMKACGEIDFNELDVALRKCAKGLDQPQFEKFVSWIMNPSCVAKGTMKDPFPKDNIIRPAPPAQEEEEKTESSGLSS